ncbi:DUF4269 domain-containing protein [Hymenobacter saemangeumensis]
MPDWLDLTYLQRGSPRQQHTYAVLQRLSLWPTLQAYGPVLTGTIPLGIDLPGSDADVICEVGPPVQTEFARLVQERYGQQPGFQLRQKNIGGHDTIVAGFVADGLAVELFGQPLPALQQNAYRHMLVEHAILAAGGAPWREAVVSLKRQGLKTEPAFAALLQLPGDPYQALLALESLSASALAARLAGRELPAG